MPTKEQLKCEHDFESFAFNKWLDPEWAGFAFGRFVWKTCKKCGYMTFASCEGARIYYYKIQDFQIKWEKYIKKYKRNSEELCQLKQI